MNTKDSKINLILPILFIICILILLTQLGLHSKYPYVLTYGLIILIVINRLSHMTVFYFFLIIVSLSTMNTPIQNLFNLNYSISSYFASLYTLLGVYMLLSLISPKSIEFVNIPNNNINRLIFLYVCVIFISLMLNIGNELGISGSMFTAVKCYSIYLIVIIVINQDHIIKGLISVKIFLFTLYTIIFLLTLILYPNYKEYYIYFAGTVGTLPLLFALKSTTNNNKINFFCNLGILVILACVLYAGSRRALMTGIISMLVFFLIERNSVKKHIVIGLVILLSLQYFAQSSYLIKRLTYTIPAIVETKGQKGMTGRMDIWKTGMVLYREKPIFGVGYKLSDYRMEDKSQSLGLDVGRTRVHNTYIKVLAETGIVGISMYILILFYTLKNLISARKYFLLSGRYKLSLYTSAYFSSYLGVFASSFFGWSGPNRMSWWLMVAYSVAFLEVAKNGNKLKKNYN